MPRPAHPTVGSWRDGTPAGPILAVSTLTAGWQDRPVTTERIEEQRTIPAGARAIFRVLCVPQGHVAIDSPVMLMSADGEPVTAEGDTFVVHMDREALND